MTVAVSWIGAGRQFTGNISTETITVVKYNGAGGTPSASAADGAIQGTDAVTVTVNKTGIAMFIALPSALNFTTTHSGQLVYVWGNFLAASLLNTLANHGFGICMSSGAPTTSNYSLWTFFGSDNYDGGWKRMILDPTKTRSAGSGTFSTSNVTHIGVFGNVGGTTARFDNLILDACDVGTGLKVTGTSTLGLVTELLANETTNRYGLVDALNPSKTAVALRGKLVLGDNTGTAAATITDENSKLFAAEPLYYNTASVAAVPLTYAKVEVVGNGPGNTNVTFGKQVGTTQGRNGISLIGNTTYNIGLDTDDGAVEASDWFGCTLENLKGTLNLDGNHNFDSQTMVGCSVLNVATGMTVNNLTSVACGQIVLAGNGKVKDSLLINNTASATVTTNSLANVTGNKFTSDGSNHAVQLSSIGGGSMSWDNTLSGYVAGTVASPVTPTSTGNEALYVNVGSGTLTVNVAAGATTPSIRSAGATVNVVAGLKTFTQTISPVPSPNYEYRLYTVTAEGSMAGSVEITAEGEENATSGSHAYTHTETNQPVAVQIISNDYVEKIAYYTLTAADLSVTINLDIDNND